MSVRLRARTVLLASAIALSCTRGDEHAPARSATKCADGGPLLAFDDVPPVGFDAPFEIALRPRCPEARALDVSWTQVAGPATKLERVDGLRARGKTAPFSRAAAELPWGVVPISADPDERGELAFRGEAQVGGERVSAVARVASLSRAGGVHTFAVSQRVLVGGAGWKIKRAPSDAPPALDTHDGWATLQPAGPGAIELEDAAGRTLHASVGRHADVPLDCGRATCHVETAARALASPMTSVLQRGLEGALGAAYDPSCAIACHATGEPGLDDGGFVAIARELDAKLPSPGAGAWNALGRSLRRAGGVGCTACHGPATIPDASARWTILRTGVCAVCHEGPPRYAYASSWKSSRLSRSDRDPRTRSAKCASCHTTAGFLASLGVPSVRRPPDSSEPIGIACAACHAPHGKDTRHRLLREVHVPSALASFEARSRVCVPCHADDAAGGSSAALVVAGARKADGAAAGGPHASLGCVGCHMSRGRDQRGVDHAFVARAPTCAPCHDAGKPAVTSALHDRALALWKKLEARGAVASMSSPGPLHAAERPVRATGELAEAARAIALVLEDPAAAVHNPAFARGLLDEAERALGAP